MQLDSFCQSRKLEYLPKYDPLSWNDYSITDISLAIRKFGKDPYYHKPMSKLVNAALADCLVIAAPESSSLYFKKHYYPTLPIVSTETELMHAIEDILKEPDKYFIELYECKRKIGQLTEEGVLAQWEKMLLYANSKFESWRSQSKFARDIFLKYRGI